MIVASVVSFRDFTSAETVHSDFPTGYWPLITSCTEYPTRRTGCAVAAALPKHETANDIDGLAWNLSLNEFR
jgi:hypothetical protein